MDDDLADDFPPKQHAMLLRRLRLILLVVVVLAVIVVLALSVEPARAAVWRAVGQQCGMLDFPRTPVPPVPRDYVPAEDCFAIAYYRCQAATLTARQSGIDTILTQTFVVEPALAFVLPCGLADVWSSSVDAGRIRRSGTESCQGLTQQPDGGLLFQGCGQLGDIVVPSVP